MGYVSLLALKSYNIIDRMSLEKNYKQGLDKKKTFALIIKETLTDAIHIKSKLSCGTILI